MAEFRFWFVKLAGLKVAHFLLRKHEEAVIKEALETLVEEYGRRRTTAEEMLVGLMAGNKVPQKDIVAVDKFFSSLKAIYYVALDTGRADDKKSLFKSILKNKLPQFKWDWIKKWSKNEVKNGPKIFFLDFLSPLKMAVRVARNMDNIEASIEVPKTAFRRADSGGRSTFGNSNQGPWGSISGWEFPLLRPTYLKNGEDPIYKKRNDESTISHSQKRGDEITTSQNARVPLHFWSEENIEAKSESYCAICEKPHLLKDCPTFLASSPDDRATLCRNKNLCLKYLKPCHMARTCFSKARFSACVRLHHGTIHGSLPPASQMSGNVQVFVPNITTFAVKPAEQKSPTAPRESAWLAGIATGGGISRLIVPVTIHGKNRGIVPDLH